MASAVGEEGKKRSKTIDFLLLLGASLFVAAGSTAVFWVADGHHINLAWLMHTKSFHPLRVWWLVRMNCRDSSSLNGYSMQLISKSPLKTADCQRPKPERIVPLVVIRIGSVTDKWFSLAAWLNSSISPVQPNSSNARCSLSCCG
jgi:hypothetical protein